MNYLIIANVYLILFYGFYRIFLSRETFFQLNRVYLVGIAVLSFILPLIQLEWLQNAFRSSTVFVARSGLDSVTIDMEADRNLLNRASGVRVPLWIYVYIGGVLIQFLLLTVKMKRLRKRLQTNNYGDAYSFIRTIKVDTEQEGSAKVMEHELVHAKQLHTLDVLYVELVKVFNWFNPVVYYLADSLKLTHEYIADEAINRSDADRIAYAELLLGRTFSVSSSVLTNNFLNQSFIKNRIVMLLKNKSKRSALLKYILVVPLFIGMLIFSSAKVSDQVADLARHDQKATNFYKLVGSNIRYLPKAKVDGAEGIVDIAFEKKNNSIETKVVNSFGYEQEKEVIRVLLQPDVKEEMPTGKNLLRVKFMLQYDEGDHRRDRSGAKPDIALAKLAGYANLEELIIVGYGSSASSQKPDVRWQDSTKQKATDFNELDVQPSFPGGMRAFYKWIGENFRYSTEAKEKGVNGSLLLSFVIEKDGTLNDIEVLKDLGYGTGQAAIDLLKGSPKWSPGQKNGESVRVSYSLPIQINLSKAEPKAENSRSL